MLIYISNDIQLNPKHIIGVVRNGSFSTVLTQCGEYDSELPFEFLTSLLNKQHDEEKENEKEFISQMAWKPVP